MSESRGPTERFSDRVESYIAYRPSYPRAVIDCLVEELGLRPHHVVADVGSGTGLLSELFLDNGNVVYGVEPNAPMREAAETLLAGQPRFHSVAGRAEETGLGDTSVDFVTAGQSFHWFETAPTRREFQRILQPSGSAVLVWNTRRTSGSSFAESYEALLRRWGIDYVTVSSRYGAGSPLDEFFAPDGYERRVFENRQAFDYEGLEGRLLSSSYIPGVEQPGHNEMLAALRELFSGEARDGFVVMEYDTEVFFGRLEG